jgi:tripartite-type tricarboxylate transporter receptor subunit TctC
MAWISLLSDAIAAVAAVTASAAMAEPASVADFYRGKTISIVVGSDSGGGYDINARTLARYLGRYIPGNPPIIVQNKPGASSLVATNYVWSCAEGRYRDRRCTAADSVPNLVRPRRRALRRAQDPMARQHHA